MRMIGKLLSELSAICTIGGWSSLLEYLAHAGLNLPSIVRTRTLASVDHAMAGKVRTFRAYGQLIRLDGALFAGAREIYGRGVYFAMPGFRLKPDDVVIDLGANSGVFTTLAGVLAGKVVAVEAQSDFIQEIHSNATINGCAHKVAIEFGIIGADSGLFSDRRCMEAASHFRRTPPSISMGELFDHHHIQKVNFLKADIEGSEFSLFTGDLDWLSRVERIAMEVHLEFGDVDELVQLLQRHSFRVQLLDNDQRKVCRISGKCGYLFASREGLDDPCL